LAQPERPLRVLVAPDSFKGSLSSVAVARALADGWSRGRPTDTIELAPLADGGEGLLDAVAAAGGWASLPAAARDPLGRPLDGRFLRRGDAAVVELAVASGLSRLASDARDASTAGAASTFGTGQILATAIALGCRDIVLGMGGSATTDGGAGLLLALGARFLDAEGHDLAPGGDALARLARVELDDVAPILAEVRLTIASDVSNPLLGALGAAATYGPQKGADAAQVERLDAALAHYADLIEAASGTSLRDVPGAGAAGGTTAGLLAIADRFAALRIRPGIEVVMQLTDFEARLARSDVALTGEGHVDAQTAFGKTALGVARRAAAAGVACLCFGGGVTAEGEAALRALGVVTLSVSEAPMTVEEAMAAGAPPIERAAERAARLLSLGAMIDP
jgi:glycerate kinase